jgi:hypothetical protein
VNATASFAARQPKQSSVGYVPVAVNDLEFASFQGKLEVSRYGSDNVGGPGRRGGSSG